MIAILDKTCYTALKNHARTYSIFSALRQEKSPPCAMLFRSKALHLTRLVRFFRLMYSFVQRLYLLYMYLGLDVTCIFCNLSRQVKYRC